MSFTGDVLTSSSPARLLCRRGKWLLEIVRFVAVDRNVFQPRTQRLEGSEVILQHLKRGEHAALAAATSQLIRGLRTDEDHSFEAVDGDWVPDATRGRDSVPPGPGQVGPNAAASAANEVAELRAELLVLRVSHERLRERVLRLESQLLAGGEIRINAQASVAMDALGLPKIQEAPRPARGAPEPTSIPSPAPEPPAAAKNAGSIGTDATAISPGADKPAAEPRIKFPTVAALNVCLHALIGDQVSFLEGKPVTFAPKPSDPHWVSKLIDEEGVEAGAIVVTARATATLGGMLMMVPPLEIESQRKAKAPSADSIEAMSEVSNNLSGAFNQVPGAIHLRVKPMEPLAGDALAWVTPGTLQLQLDIAGDLGRLFVFSR